MHEARAKRVWALVRRYFADEGFADVPDSEWIFRDHTHEDLSPGAWSLACEGSLPPDWAVEVSGAPEVRAEMKHLVVFLEPINGCILGIYDDA